MRRKVHARAKFYVIVIALMMIFFGISCGISAHRMELARDHADALETQGEILTIKVRELGEMMEYMKTDEFIERFARDELQLIRPGEIRYVNH